MFEGIDASGKTTQARLLGEKLRSLSLPFLITAEPSEGKTGEFIKGLLSSREAVNPRTMALLFAADRADHLDSVIVPALSDGKVVICDRYYFSSLAYQGALGVPLNYIRQVNAFVEPPDLGIFIDISPEQASTRLSLKTDRQLTETAEIQELAYAIYKELSRAGELVSVNGNLSAEELAASIWKLVLPVLKNRGYSVESQE